MPHCLVKRLHIFLLPGYGNLFMYLTLDVAAACLLPLALDVYTGELDQRTRRSSASGLPQTTAGAIGSRSEFSIMLCSLCFTEWAEAIGWVSIVLLALMLDVFSLGCALQMVPAQASCPQPSSPAQRPRLLLGVLPHLHLPAAGRLLFDHYFLSFFLSAVQL